MKPRIPLAYAGLLIIALVAVVGFAAFSPSADEPTTDTVTAEDTTDAPPASARVASAILALRVSDADARTATTEADTTTTQPAEDADDTRADEGPASDGEGDAVVEELTVVTEAPTTSEEPTTTVAPTTTAAPAPPADTTPPALRVTSPEDGDTVSDRVVTFRGTTEPGASVSSGPFEATVDDDGSWSLQLVLAPGANGAAFSARDAAGNTTDVRIVVTYEPPTTTTSPPATTTTTTADSGSSDPKWSPLWPADAGGRRNVEVWRPLVEQYWPADLVACALNIIDMESEGDPRAYNSRSGAEGLFQHLSKYWKNRAAAAGFRDSNGLYATPYNAEANIAAAWLIAKGSNPWHRPWTVNPFYGDCTE